MGAAQTPGPDPYLLQVLIPSQPPLGPACSVAVRPEIHKGIWIHKVSEGTILFHLGNTEQLTFKAVTIHWESAPEHHGSISQGLQMARDYRIPYNISVPRAFHSHPGCCWEASHSSRSVLYKMPRRTKQVTRELLAMRTMKTLGTSSTFLMLLITKGNQRWARFKVNPL